MRLEGSEYHERFGSRTAGLDMAVFAHEELGLGSRNGSASVVRRQRRITDLYPIVYVHVHVYSIHERLRRWIFLALQGPVGTADGRRS